MKSVPRFLKGAFRNALEIAINAASSADQLTTAWLEIVHVDSKNALPPARGGLISKDKFSHRFATTTLRRAEGRVVFGEASLEGSQIRPRDHPRSAILCLMMW